MVRMDFRSILVMSAVLRLLLILYGEWQDSHMEVRYTDVDYIVFSDAASLVASRKSPFARSTYRYSPLLAFLLVPNSIFHRSWGKFVFSASVDNWSPAKIWHFSRRTARWLGENVKSFGQSTLKYLWVALPDLLVGLFIYRILKLRHVPEKLCLYSLAAWLFNPFTFTIGTRGNCEPIVCAMVLWIIISLMNGNMLLAAFWYGLLVHFRIYPIIYSLPILLVLEPHNFRFSQKPALQDWILGEHKSSELPHTKSINLSDTCRRLIFYLWFLFKSMFTRERILFGLFSGAVFFSWTALFFYIYGWDFLNEALLYHLIRTDPRHNFSIYFYYIYLHHEQGLSVVEKLISFLPQLIVQLVLSLRFAKDLPFCFFVQTVAFVAFNKVVTAQYFVWFFCLLPLILPWNKMKLKWKGSACIFLWVVAQIHWLMWGYLLEFKGKNVLIQLWLASILFLAANAWVLIMVMRHHRFTPIFIQSRERSSADHRKIN